MKKILCALLIILSLVLTSCDNENNDEAIEFISDFSTNSLLNKYEVNDNEFGFKLSTNSSQYIQYMRNDTCTIFNIKDERSFVHQSEENAIESNDISAVYFYVNTENKLYQIIDNHNELVIEANDDSVNSLIDHIVTNQASSNVYSNFDELNLVISELLKDLEPSSISAPGSNDIRLLTVTLDKANFFGRVSSFSNHINEIYDQTTSELILSKIQNSSHDKFHIELLWDKSSNTLVPYFSISFQNFEYYIVTSVIDDFVIDIPKCN